MTMSTEAINTPVEVPEWTPGEESIRWTRKAAGSYQKQGSLPADTPAVRIFEIDEDYEINPHAVCAGQKSWPKEEAVALVEQKIAGGSYQAWRYEIRPELSSAGPPPVPAMAPSESSTLPLCSNPCCKKGPNGTRGIVKSQRAKYCCGYCRVDVCRRSRPTPEQIEKPKRKRRKDAKYASHAERQRAHQARHSTAGFTQAIRDPALDEGKKGQDGRQTHPGARRGGQFPRSIDSMLNTCYQSYPSGYSV